MWTFDWLTASVPTSRDRYNDSVLVLLRAGYSIFRCIWQSTRRQPASVNASQESSKPLTTTFACLAGKSRVSNSDLDSTGKARNAECNLQYLEDVLCGGTGLEARLTLTDKQWRLIEPALPGRPGTPGRSGNNNRMSLEGMIWITRTGRLGGTCPGSSETGTLCTGASGAGRSPAFSSESST